MKIDHIGVAVEALEAAAEFYRDLGLESVGVEDIPSESDRAAFFQAGESRIELLESTDPEGPIGRFLAKRGAGLHHICIEVPDVAAALGALGAKGYRLLDPSPRTGAGGRKVAFVHPKSSGGVLLELTEEVRE